MDSAFIEQMVQTLSDQVQSLTFGPPIHWVYNPLTYARSAYVQYCQQYGGSPKEVVLLGMNPGPWGMVQTGIPFGDVAMVTQWLGMRPVIDMVTQSHPKRPVLGLACTRKEISGQRLWGWAKARFGTPDRFFKRFWVANYCPLAFLEQSGRNRTPDRLPKSEKESLVAICDQALVQTIKWLHPRIVVGIGRFAALQARRALCGMDVRVGQITHPSPASPKANQGWSTLIERELAAIGVKLT